MANSYGKSALSVDLVAPDISKYLAKIEAAGNNVDEACKAAVNAALPIVEKSMKAGAARHRKGTGKYGTDAVYDAIETTPAKQVGNYISGNVGIDTGKHPQAKAAYFEEYGDGHSPEFPDRFIRPALDDNKKEILATERAVLKKKGVPID